MALLPGVRIGPYEIVSSLGAGGMGEVYRATDSNFGRQVAIKVLPDAFASDPERVTRFEREAKTLASLNHPSIAIIHGLEKSQGTYALVMELVEGEDLSQRIARGPIPLDEALPIAKQIAEALEAAHEQGIIHRDLKPANIKVTPDGRVKVLDFGLAKLAEPSLTAASPSPLSLSPTITSPALMTGVGVLLGTAAYMSPEQAKGKPADKRSDIWAFGCVLYEMLTGKRAFEGEDVADTLAAVLRGALDWAILPHDVPDGLRTVVARCLEKDRSKRIADLSIALFLMDERSSAATASGRVSTVVPNAPVWRRAIPVVATAALAGAIVGAVAWRLRPSTPPPIVTRFAVTPAEGQRFSNTGRQIVAMSPDGTRMVYVANTQLHLRSMSGVDTKPLRETNTPQGVLNPVFSPDGESIAFWSAADSTIKRISVEGGPPVTVCPAERPFGITWTTSGILFGEGPSGLMRVAASGGRPEVLLKVGAGEVADGPQLLPDGETVLFTLATGIAADRWDRAKIVAWSSKSGQQKTLLEGGSDAVYVSSGHLVYAYGGSLFAVPFDVERLEVIGSAVPVIQGVSRADSPGQQTGIAHFSVSNTGSLMYVEGPVSAAVNRRDFIRVDRTGKPGPLKLPSGPNEFPRVSPDGKRLTFGTDDGKEAIVWVYDLSGTSAMRRLTFGGRSRFPIWSADGERIAFQSDREGDAAIFWQRADGTGTAERLTRPDKGTAHVPQAWAPSGDRFLFASIGTGETTGSSLWSLSLKDKKPELFGGVQFSGTTRPPSAVFSPDGRWVAYASFDSNLSFSVYVQPFPATGAKYQVGSGNFPRWSPDGKELFYLEGDQLFFVTVRAQAPFTFGNKAAAPGQIFPSANALQPARQFDIAPDNSIISAIDSAQASSSATSSPRIEVVLNWFEELKRLVPTK